MADLLALAAQRGGAEPAVCVVRPHAVAPQRSPLPLREEPVARGGKRRTGGRAEQAGAGLPGSDRGAHTAEVG